MAYLESSGTQSVHLIPSKGPEVMQSAWCCLRSIILGVPAAVG